MNGGVARIQFSPDGNKLGIRIPKLGLSVWDTSRVDEGAILLPNDAGELRNFAFSPDGAKVYTASGDEKSGAVTEWEVATGRQFRKLETHKNSINAVAVSPDGKLIASGAQDGRFAFHRLPEGKFVWQGNSMRSPVLALKFSHGGDMLGNGWYLERVWNWNIAPRELPDSEWLKGLLPANRFDSGSDIVTCLDYAPDDKAMTVAGNNHAELWDMPERNKRPTRRYSLPGRENEFSPDGRYLATAGGGILKTTIILWDAAEGRQVRRFSGGHTDHIYTIAFSPHGKLLLSGDAKGRLAIWDVETGARLHGVKSLVGPQ